MSSWGLSIFLCLLILFLEKNSSRRPSYFWSYFWKNDHISTDHTSHLRDRCGDESGAVHRMLVPCTSMCARILCARTHPKCRRAAKLPATVHQSQPSSPPPSTAAPHTDIYPTMQLEDAMRCSISCECGERSYRRSDRPVASVLDSKRVHGECHGCMVSASSPVCLCVCLVWECLEE